MKKLEKTNYYYRLNFENCIYSLEVTDLKDCWSQVVISDADFKEKLQKFAKYLLYTEKSQVLQLLATLLNSFETIETIKKGDFLEIQTSGKIDQLKINWSFELIKLSANESSAFIYNFVIKPLSQSALEQSKYIESLKSHIEQREKDIQELKDLLVIYGSNSKPLLLSKPVEPFELNLDLFRDLANPTPISTVEKVEIKHETIKATTPVKQEKTVDLLKKKEKKRKII